MDRRPRTCNRQSNSSIILSNNEIDEDGSNYSSSSNSSQQASGCDLSLEVQIAKSLERMISSRSTYHNNSALLDVRLLKNGPNDRSAHKILLDKVDLPLYRKSRKKLLEECKIKLKGNSSNQSMYSNRSTHRPVHKKHEDRSNLRRKNPYREEERKICVNSAPINTQTKQFNCLTGKSNVFSRSVDTVKGDRYIYGPRLNSDKQGREMGDYRPSRASLEEESTETSSDEHLYYKAKLEDGKELEVGDTSQQVYTTARTSNIRKLLKCQNPKRHKENPKEPCFCQHCGMADVLLESQKRLVTDDASDFSRPIPEKNEDMKPRSLRSRKEISNKPERAHSNVNARIVNDLCEKLKTLESAIQAQEEKFVTKEYLKIVVDKIISYVTARPDRSMKTNRFNSVPVRKSIATQCSKTFIKKDIATLKITPLKRKQNDRIVGSAISSPKNTIAHCNLTNTSISDKETVVSVKTFTGRDYMSGGGENAKHNTDVFWKWGDEVIKPGFDLKNKIAQLISERFSGPKPSKSSSSSKRIDTNAESSSEKTLYLCGSENQANTAAEERKSKDSINGGSNFKKMLDIMSEKIYTDYINDQKSSKKSQALEQTKFPRDVKKAVNDDVFKRNMQNARKKTESLRKDEVEEKETNVAEKIKDSNIPIKRNPSQKSLKRSLIPKYKRNDGVNQSYEATGGSRVRVTYMSPKAESWNKDSCMCFKVEQHFKRFLSSGCNGPISRAGKHPIPRNLIQGYTYTSLLYFQISLAF